MLGLLESTQTYFIDLNYIIDLLIWEVSFSISSIASKGTTQ